MLPLIWTCQGYYGVTSESGYSEKESLCTRLSARFVTQHASLLPWFSTHNPVTDNVSEVQSTRERFHSSWTREGYYGATSESSHSEKESLCTRLRACFGTHHAPLLPWFSTPNPVTGNVSEVQSTRESSHLIWTR